MQPVSVETVFQLIPLTKANDCGRKEEDKFSFLRFARGEMVKRMKGLLKIHRW